LGETLDDGRGPEEFHDAVEKKEENDERAEDAAGPESGF
jgi:hypothetical protein